MFDKSLNTNVLMSNEIYIYRNIDGKVFLGKLTTENGRRLAEKISKSFLENTSYKFKK
jgi:protein-arginine kinase